MARQQCSLLLALVGGSICAAWLLVASAASASAPPRFLALPFASVSEMAVQRGWWAGDLFHHAIDYIRGTPNVPVTWQSFEVLAAASGEACAQLAGRHGCVDIPDEKVTNRVAIRHRIEGRTYTTVYEDLRSIAAAIPVGGQFVRVARGQSLGFAGSGEGNPPDLIHLHFEVLDARSRPVDPYAIYGRTSAVYPDPAGTNGLRCGAARLWIADPPRVPPSRARAAASTATPQNIAPGAGLTTAGPVLGTSPPAITSGASVRRAASASASRPMPVVLILAIVGALAMAAAALLAGTWLRRHGRHAPVV